MPLHPDHHPHLARPPRRRPLRPKSSRHHCQLLQPCLPTLCPTAHRLACLWAPLPKEPCSQPHSQWYPSPPSPTGGLWAPLTHQPSRDPGLQLATLGPHRGVYRPGQAIPWPQLVPLALATPRWGAGPPVLVILNSPPTSQQQENPPTQHSPSFRASQDNPSHQCPLSPHIPQGLPLPMGFHLPRGPPGLAIDCSPGPCPSLLPPVPQPLAQPSLSFQVKLEVESVLPVDLSGHMRALEGPGWECAGP